MKLKGFFSILLALCLLTAPLCSLAEGVLANPAAEETPVPANALEIEVTYDEENAEWDGRLSAQVRVIWNGPDSGTSAKDVWVSMETEDGLKLAKGEEKLELGDIEPDSAVIFGIELEFDHSVETPDYVPEPTLKITAGGSNTDYTVYTCRLDGTTEPRMMIIGADVGGTTPDAIINDTNMVKETFSGSYYNKYPLDITPPYLDPENGIAVLESM